MRPDTLSSYAITRQGSYTPLMKLVDHRKTRMFVRTSLQSQSRFLSLRMASRALIHMRRNICHLISFYDFVSLSTTRTTSLSLIQYSIIYPSVGFINPTPRLLLRTAPAPHAQPMRPSTGRSDDIPHIVPACVQHIRGCAAGGRTHVPTGHPRTCRICSGS
jgi:hypothetical protein